MQQAVKEFPSKKLIQHFLDRSFTTRELIFIVFAFICATPIVSPPIALLIGIFIAQFVGHPYLQYNAKASHLLLQVSVVGLGFGMNLGNAIKSGREGLTFTLVSIFTTLILGFIFGKMLRLDKKIAYLVSVGTAICGGSAIVAVSPVIRADEKQVSVALGTIFILNAIALFLFPTIGHLVNLSPTQFGMWCAIAIHDTSSVVGAASKYGTQALEVATTVKLVRALWIVPVAFASSFLFKNEDKKIKLPYFIAFFVLAMFMNTYFTFIQHYGHYMVLIAKSGLTLTLFLIGSGLSRSVLAAVGFRPLVQGILLWLIISCLSLWVIVGMVQ